MNRTRGGEACGSYFSENTKTFLNVILHHVRDDSGGHSCQHSVDQMLAGMLLYIYICYCKQRIADGRSSSIIWSLAQP